MAKRKAKVYFDLGWLVSLILVIIPFTNVVLGIVTRLQRGKILGAVLNFFLAPLFWIVDIVTFVLSGDLTFLA